MIRIKENIKPNITKINFACDNEIHKKLNKYELTKEFLNKSNTTLMIGRQGSGKTSLLINLIKSVYKKCFHKIYIFMPYNSRKSLEDNILDKHLPKEQLFDELNFETIEHLYNELKANSEQGLKSLVIYDDVQKSLKDPLVLRSLKNIIANQRHLGVVNILLLQNYFALDKSLRELCQNIIVFKLNKTQTEKIFSECIETAKDRFMDISKFVYDKPYQWLFVNLPTQRLFKEWDEILLDENEEF